MELSNYELVRYPSGQLVLTRLVRTASGAPSSGPRDVVGVYTSENEAQRALDELAGRGAQPAEGEGLRSLA
jgi:transposase-like protein